MITDHFVWRHTEFGYMVRLDLADTATQGLLKFSIIYIVLKMNDNSNMYSRSEFVFISTLSA